MENVIEVLLPYLPDFWKMQLMLTCKTYYFYRDKVMYKSTYKYRYVRHLPFLRNFNHVFMTCRNREYIPCYVGGVILKESCELSALPNTVEYIHMLDGYCKSIQLPKKFLNIYLSQNYDEPIKFPDGVKSAGINERYDCSILPESVNELWCDRYNGYPSGVTDLVCATITKFPPNIKKLDVTDIQCDIADMPKTIKMFRYTGDISINLPFPIHTYKYYGPLTEDVVFLEGIKKLSVTADRDITITVPESVEHLKIDSGVYIVEYNLPQRLKSLTTDVYSTDNVPDSIEYLNIKYINCVNNFPKNLKTLIIREFGYGIADLPNVEILSIDIVKGLKVPKSVKHLKIGDSFDDELFVPENVITLKLGNKFNSRITFAPNSKLQYVKFGAAYNLYTEFPDSVRKIKFGEDFNQHFISKATYIRFGDSFNQYINMPDLKWLRVGSHFQRTIVAPNLKTLKTCGWATRKYTYPDVEELI